MKNNGPVTQKPIQLNPDKILVSKTDLKGCITYCNQDFIEVSGFSESELIGKNHNIVRHPDMPTEAFADLWNHMKAAKPWSGVVKNRAKNGDHYWVIANVTPIYRDDQLVEYMSVRNIPTQEQIEAAEALYGDIRKGLTKLKTGTNPISRILEKVSTSALLYAAVGASAAVFALVAAMLVAGWSHDIILATLATGGIFSAVGGVLITRRVMRPLNYAIGKLKQISQGNYFDWVTTRREDEFGQLLLALRAMQTQLGFEVLDAREQAMRTGRIKTALDNASANVMIADASNRLIYCNPSLTETLDRRAQALKTIMPDFDASGVIGRSIDDFHRRPEQQQGVIANLSTTFRSNLELDGCHLQMTATPIFDDEQHRIGTVMEWVDRTEQVAIENEVHNVVENARAGQLHHRLTTEGKEGFFKNLSQSVNELLEVNETVLEESIQALAALASGDLTRTVNGSYEGAFEALKSNINASIQQLTSMIEQITQTASTVENGVSEIATGNEDLARRTENQVTQLERSAAAMEEINGTIQHSADNAVEATELATRAKQYADNSGEVIGSAIEAMNAIREANSHIQSITDMIDGIAFQTNLLALNAAVEAAHAADHGHGFSVVANEVRSLSQKTSTAAREVQTLIRDSMGKVETGTDLVFQSGDFLRQIIEQSSSVSEKIEEISVASQEQASGVTSISRSIVELDNATQENAALVQQTSAANQSLLTETRELTKLVERFQLPTSGKLPGSRPSSTGRQSGNNSRHAELV